MWNSVCLQGEPEMQELCGERLGGGNLRSLTGAAVHLGVPSYPNVVS